MPSAHSWMPHGYCFAWDPWVLAVTLAGDGLTALAYFAIPFLIVRRFSRFGLWTSPATFTALTIGFALFIVTCGVSHVVNIVVLWFPTYRLDAAVKLTTGLISVGVACVLALHSPRHAESSLEEAPSLNAVRTLLDRLEQS